LQDGSESAPADGLSTSVCISQLHTDSAGESMKHSLPVDDTDAAASLYIKHARYDTDGL